MSFDCNMRAARESSRRGLVLVFCALVLAIAAFAVLMITTALAEAKPKRHPVKSPRMTLAATGTPYPSKVLGGRPHFCPARYCGCAMSVHVFGWHDKALDAAAAWYRFAPVTPMPGAVGIRLDGHHVVQLLEHVGGSNWLVYDPNSGGGLTREHVRDISDMTTVDPHFDNSRVARRRLAPVVAIYDKHGA